MSEIKSKYQPDAEYRFFLYSAEARQPLFYKSKEDRDEAAKEEIDAYLDEGTWYPEVTTVIAGEVTHHAVAINVVHAPKREDFDSDGEFDDALSDFGGDEHDRKCNYALRPIDDNGDDAEVRK